MADSPAPVPPRRRPVSRRALLAGSIAVASAGVAAAAVGLPLELSRSKGGRGAGATPRTQALSESERVSHLLRRTGFGPTRDEYEHYQSLGLQRSIDELLDYESVDDYAAIARASQVPLDAANRANLPLWWLTRMANTKRPLQEKLTLFWHGLLTSQASVVQDPEALLAQNEFYRTHALGSFSTLLEGLTTDRAMMVYLDVNGSRKAAPNENFARELMELFSLGVGNYSETDVREAARAFTGWTVAHSVIDPARNLFKLDAPVFNPAQFDAGEKSFLGATGNFGPGDIVQIISRQPATARFITRRLFAYFAYPDASDDELAPFVDTFNRSNGSVRALVQAIFTSDAFYSPLAYRGLIKSPVEYAVSALRLLGVQESASLFLPAQAAALTSMGQTLFEPPNVAGWPGGTLWLNSSTMFARLNFLNQLTGGVSRPASAPALPLPKFDTAAQAVDYFGPLVFDGDPPDDVRQVVFDYAGSSATALTPERSRGVTYLLLASPQFHLA